MRTRSIRRIAAVVVLLGVALLQSQSVLADGWAYWYGSNNVDLNAGHTWHPYSHAREVTYSPYGIAIWKDEGPEVQAATYDCVHTGTRSWSTQLPNADPTGWIHVKPNDPDGDPLYFCMTFKNNSGNGVDTFDGEMNWDGPQA